MIPPILHRVWFQLNNGRDPFRDYKQEHGSFLELHPDWTVMYWNAKSARTLIRRHYEWFLPVYDAYRNAIYKIDAIRYFLLHHYGGVYADWDITFRKPIDPLLSEQRAVVVRTYYWLRHASNFFMASPRGGVFFEDVIRRLPKTARSSWNRDQTFCGTMFVAGPEFLHRCVKKRKRDVLLLPWCSFARGKCGLKQPHYHGLGVHHFASSWNVGQKAASDIKFIVAPLLVVLVCILVHKLLLF